MKNNQLLLEGRWEISLINNKTGKILNTEYTDNTIVTVGKERIARLLADEMVDDFDCLHIGTGIKSGGADVTDTELENYYDGSIADVEYESANQIIYEHLFTFPISGDLDITEAAITDNDDDESGCVILNHVFFDVPKTVNEDTNLRVEAIITVV